MQTIWGNTPATYVDYHDLLADKSIDAVFIMTPEHLHHDMAIAALKAGKHVYIEKPLAHTIEEGFDIVRAWKKSGKIVQVGTQNRSSSLYKKAKELVQQGMIGDVHFVRAFWYRNSLPDDPAWRYVIPPDANAAEHRLDRFLGPAPKRAWDPHRYFQWRLYWDYSGGISTDLLVHQTDIVNFMLDKTVPPLLHGVRRHLPLDRQDDDRECPTPSAPSTSTAASFQINYSCYFGNEQYGYGEQLCGNEGTIEVMNRRTCISRRETASRARRPASVKARQPIHLNGQNDFNEARWRHQPLPQFHPGGAGQREGDRAAAGGPAGGHFRPHGHAFVQEPEEDCLGRSRQYVPLRVARVRGRSASLQNQNPADSVSRCQRLHAGVEGTSTPPRSVACQRRTASVHCRCPCRRAATAFKPIVIPRSSGQNSCPACRVASSTASSAAAALTVPCVMAGFVSKRKTPSCVSGLVAHALWPDFANQACAASWLSWRGHTSASRTLTSSKCRFIPRPAVPARVRSKSPENRPAHRTPAGH